MESEKLERLLPLASSEQTNYDTYTFQSGYGLVASASALVTRGATVELNVDMTVDALVISDI